MISTPCSQYLEVLVGGELVRQVYGLMGAPLWYHHNAVYLLDLRVVRWGHSIQVARDLCGGKWVHCSHRHTIALYVLLLAQVTNKWEDLRHTCTRMAVQR